MMEVRPTKSTAQQMTTAPGNTPAESKEWLASLLVEVAENRSRRAFTQIFKHFAPKIQAYAARQFGSESYALDLVQETMSNVWRKAHLFKPEKGSPSTWVFTIARNARFDMLRKQRKRQGEVSADDLYPMLADEAPGADDDYAMDDEILLQQIHGYYQQLPDAQRIIIERIYIQGQSQQEVSDSLDVPLGTVKSRARLALQKLRELIIHD